MAMATKSADVAPDDARSHDAPLPPSSHRSQRRSRAKHGSSKADPFLELPDHITLTEGERERPGTGDEGAGTRSTSSPPSLVEQLVLTPLNMVALLLSLFVVDYRNRQWRVSQHSAEPDSVWHHLFRHHAEPYQDVNDSTWRHGGGADSGNTATPTPYAAADNGSFQGWFRRKKHRAMAKLEFNDALEMRTSIITALLVCVFVAALAAWYVVKHILGWAFHFCRS